MCLDALGAVDYEYPGGTHVIASPREIGSSGRAHGPRKTPLGYAGQPEIRAISPCSPYANVRVGPHTALAPFHLRNGSRINVTLGGRLRGYRSQPTRAGRRDWVRADRNSGFGPAVTAGTSMLAQVNQNPSHPRQCCPTRSCPRRRCPSWSCPKRCCPRRCCPRPRCPRQSCPTPHRSR
jgi:hypothetical protein